MDGWTFIEIAMLVMLVLILLMMILTVGMKALRALWLAWYKSYYRLIEPALENYVLTGDPQPELEKLKPWQRDRFLSTLIIERLALLRGAGREYLVRLARDLGLVERNLEALGSRRRWRRARAAENLGYFGGSAAAEPVAALLADGDETVRAVAARALARIGSGGAVRALVRTLDDPSEVTRLRVAENLERVGHPSIVPLTDSIAGAVPLGPRGLHGPVMAAQVLGNLRAAEARAALGRAVREGDKTDIRAQAALALGKIGDPDDVPTLLEGARDEAWPVRVQAANALGMIGEVSAVPMLKELAADQEWWVRRNACQALANMGPEGEKALVEILTGEDRYARDRAAATLEARGATRRAVRNLARPGKRGEKARALVAALIGAGATKHIKNLAGGLPEGEERRILRELLGEDERETGEVSPSEIEETVGREP